MLKAPQRVPMANPAADQAGHEDEIIAAVKRVISRGQYILGPEVRAFEMNMAERLGVSGAVGVGSGTDALVISLVALGVGAGDEVITVSHTAGPTVAAIHLVGAVPVLIDVDPRNYCLDPKRLIAALSPKTKAIIVVHLYGQAAEMDIICEFANKHHVQIIEDCAQAVDATFRGQSVGSFGTVGCFSFYPTKNLGAVGDAGLISAKSHETLDYIRSLRTYGWTKTQYSEFPRGRSSRLDELQAAILSAKLPALHHAVERRRVIAKNYTDAFDDLPLMLPIESTSRRHVYHLYVVRCDRRDALAKHLEADGISTGIHYPYPVHLQPGLARGARIAEQLTVTEHISKEILTLPMFSSMSEEEQRRVIESVRQFFGRT